MTTDPSQQETGSGTEQQSTVDQAGSGEGQSEQETVGSTVDLENSSDLEGLRKAYKALQGGFTKKSQEYAEYKKSAGQSQRIVEEIKSNPGLVNVMRAYIQSQAGSQPQESDAGSERFSPEIAKMRQFMESQQLREAHPELKREELEAIGAVSAEYAEKHGFEIPMDHAYKLWAWDNKGAELYKKGLQDKELEIKRGRGGATARQVATGGKSHAKFSPKGEYKDRMEYIDAMLKNHGVDVG